MPGSPNGTLSAHRVARSPPGRWWIPDYLPGGRPPEQPAPPVVEAYTDHSVRLSWVKPFDWGIPILGYRVEVRSCDILYLSLIHISEPTRPY